ncbi:MAG: hypothetical protein WCA31_13355 [Acidimicrobiales bacterium]
MSEATVMIATGRGPGSSTNDPAASLGATLRVLVAGMPVFGRSRVWN